MRTSSNGGSSYDSGSSDYRWTQFYTEDEQTDVKRKFDYDESFWQLTPDVVSVHVNVGSDSGEDGVSGYVDIWGPHLVKNTIMSADIQFITATPASPAQVAKCVSSCVRNSSADVDAWTVLFSSGNIESGTINVLGLNNS